VRLWQPWIEETKAAINRYARWVFAALVLTFLVFANVATILTIMILFKWLVTGL
jgi:hypothetical protein